MQGWVFHHIGFPVSVESLKDKEGVKYSPLFDMNSLNLQDEAGIRMEAHAFGPQSSLNKRIQSQPHVAFKVTSIATWLQGREILLPLYHPFAGYQCAMINLHGQLIELLETDIPEEELWGNAVIKESLLYPNGTSCQK